MKLNANGTPYVQDSNPFIRCLKHGTCRLNCVSPCNTRIKEELFKTTGIQFKIDIKIKTVKTAKKSKRRKRK